MSCSIKGGKVGPLLETVWTQVFVLRLNFWTFSASVCFGMDWTLKTPLHWDWETLTLFSKKDAEISKSAHQPDWKFAGGRGIHHANGNGSVNSSDAGAFSGSELGYGSSRSSISVSIGSTSKDGSRTPQFNFDSVEQSPENLKKNKDLARVETGIMHRVVASDGPEKPLICLKLGKRTHLKDVSEGNNNKNPSSLSSTNLSTGLIKKPKVSQQHMQNSYCQVEGCNVDLTSAKDYHRKHKVCESHSKSPEVIVSGQERRFCQQCSRFHVLSEFDQKKRSCRRRLSDHNARRRKPHPETIPFTSSMFPASYYGGRQQTNLIFGQDPFGQVKNMVSSKWDDSGGFKLIPTKLSWVNSSEPGSVDAHLHLQYNDISNKISTSGHDMDRLLAFRAMTDKAPNKGLGAPADASYLDGASDLRRALSLLSAESWVPSNPEPVSDFQFTNARTLASYSATCPTNTTTGIQQQDELPLAKPYPLNLQSNGSQFPEFQLHKTTF
ncbi:unnamed protein product [Musa acuminata subsp. burmannicoides]